MSTLRSAGTESPSTEGAPRVQRPHDATLYGLLHRGTPGDVAFYRELCARAHRVLELGCGYGRMLWPIASEGRGILVGLDRDRALLGAALRADPGDATRRVHLVRADMRDFALRVQFDRIVVAYNTIYTLLRPEDVAACLRRVATHLAPGGVLAIDAWAADAVHPELLEEGEQETNDALGDLTFEGRRYGVLERCLYAPAQQRIDASYLLVPKDPGGRHREDMIRQRYLRRPELEGLLSEAGLAVRSWHGGFDGEPLTLDSDRWVLTATLAT